MCTVKQRKNLNLKSNHRKISTSHFQYIKVNIFASFD